MSADGILPFCYKAARAGFFPPGRKTVAEMAMAQGASETSGTRPRLVGRRCGKVAAAGFVLFIGGLLGPRAAWAEETAPAAARSAAELVPAGTRFFLEVDLKALKEHGPHEAVRRAISTLEPLASESGLSAERLNTVVMASADELLNGDRLPSWLLFAQAGAPPPLGKLETAFRRYTRAPLKPGSLAGLPYRGNSDLSLMQLPGGPTLVAGAAGPAEIVAAWQGKGQTPLLQAGRAEILQRVTGDRASAAAFRLWLTLTSAMQRSLVEDAHVPAAPLELASALRLLPDRSAELWVVTRCSDEETAKRLATWLSSRLATLASSSEVQLLGLSGYLQASKVASEGPLTRLQLTLGAADVAALFERAIGMLGSLAPRPAAAPAPDSSKKPGPARPKPAAKPTAAGR